MLKKTFLIAIAVSILNLTCVSFLFASSLTEKEAKFAEKVRSQVEKLGTGTDAKIEVKLKDGTKLKGYVREADDKRFVVVSDGHNETIVLYPQVQKVKGNNWAKGIIIPILIFAPVIIGLIIYSVQSKHGRG